MILSLLQVMPFTAQHLLVFGFQVILLSASNDLYKSVKTSQSVAALTINVLASKPKQRIDFTENFKNIVIFIGYNFYFLFSNIRI